MLTIAAYDRHVEQLFDVLINKVHLQDMDSVGLITPEIESQLPEPLPERLRQVRAEE